MEAPGISAFLGSIPPINQQRLFQLVLPQGIYKASHSPGRSESECLQVQRLAARAYSACTTFLQAVWQINGKPSQGGTPLRISTVSLFCRAYSVRCCFCLHLLFFVHLSLPPSVLLCCLLLIQLPAQPLTTLLLAHLSTWPLVHLSFCPLALLSATSLFSHFSICPLVLLCTHILAYPPPTNTPAVYAQRSPQLILHCILAEHLVPTSKGHSDATQTDVTPLLYWRPNCSKSAQEPFPLCSDAALYPCRPQAITPSIQYPYPSTPCPCRPYHTVLHWHLSYLELDRVFTQGVVQRHTHKRLPVARLHGKHPLGAVGAVHANLVTALEAKLYECRGQLGRIIGDLRVAVEQVGLCNTARNGTVTQGRAVREAVHRVSAHIECKGLWIVCFIVETLSTEVSSILNTAYLECKA